MPRTDGYELCGALKSDPQLRDVPVILLAALTDVNDVFRGLEAGADGFPTKPYTAVDMLAAVFFSDFRGFLMFTTCRSGSKALFTLSVFWHFPSPLIRSFQIGLPLELSNARSLELAACSCWSKRNVLGHSR